MPTEGSKGNEESGITVSLETYRELERDHSCLQRYCRDLEFQLDAMKKGKPDEVEERVITAIRERRARGRFKYGTTMERKDLSVAEWLQHAQEEAMDLAIYLERLKQETVQTAGRG